MRKLFLFVLSAILVCGCTGDDAEGPIVTGITVHNPQKGGLQSVLTKMGTDVASIVSLKITGTLNYEDIQTIRAMTNLKSLDIGEVDMTVLPTGAFYQLTIENLILPNTLTTIRDSAFEECKSLTTIEIPASVETIEEAAFKGCSSLATVTFEKGSQLKTIGGDYLFNGYFYISYGAFWDCTALTTIEIPASVETIEAAAFGSCSKLATVTFEKGSQLKTIGGRCGYDHFYRAGAFACCPITTIEIPASVETIEAGAFCWCSKLATVTFEKGSQLKTIGGGYYSSSSYGAFSECKSLTTIEIPASVETIEAAAFHGCSELATVTFEKGSQLKTIGGGYFDTGYGTSFYGAFCQLENLMTVDMSACTQVETIGDYAFYGDSELRLFKIGTETPPTCVYNAFSGINPYSVLKVPSGCADAYKAKYGWSEFASITGLDE